ncbi:protein FAM86A-like protein [Leptotrombidium deliense]|uniref:Protein FAM86A-like protein n=1 Tax=Leptotrombidium deliense TaxID=299467 RepID=A0A443SQZ3_9ACAR|nr:protein FAM86A-like protein [Leptotrombidium deliense]
MNEDLTAVFLACSSSRFFSLLSSIKNEWTLDQQKSLCEATWSHQITRLFPRNVLVSQQSLRRFVDMMENRRIEVDDEIYEALTRLMKQKSSSTDFCTYFVKGKAVTVESRMSIVESGTTGLHCWPAAKQFATFALENSATFEHRSVVELGSGSGFTGIIVTLFCNPRKYVFTDHSKPVLELIERNLQINECNSTSSVTLLDWSAQSLPPEIEETEPEVVVACDVVFDESVIPVLCRLLVSLINRFKCKTFVLSTVRHEATLVAFEEALTDLEMKFKKQEICGSNEPPFFIDSNHKFILHEIIE